MPRNIYDRGEFFDGYSQLPRSQEVPAGAPEWEALRKMLPPVRGLRVLDMGCGFGAFASWAKEMGAMNGDRPMSRLPQTPNGRMN